MSWSDKNLAGRFRYCVDSMLEMATTKCKYFRWIDDELTPHYNNIFNSFKYELQLMKDTSYSGRPNRRIATLEKLNVETNVAKDCSEAELAVTIEENTFLVN
ncbi:unnamed protein product [Lactuca virosa]|uniref:Protein FAR1-RELATED SEQUENCE n=1 Tax=Lactuca virosa TaxID=75947 RepID=A0AAU9M0A0_9ASTR|nr:unnamed protein product [Lactuca virosa]